MMKWHSPRNRLREALKEGRIPLGIQSFSGCAALIEIAGFAGFDFVMLDGEHACVDSADIEQLIRAADGAGITPFVRVAENGAAEIRRALEAGARGVIVPQVRSSTDVKAAINAATYPPAGSRGMCPATRASQYSIAGWKEYVEWTNSAVEIIPILEHPEAIENAEEICGLDGVEIVLFGPGDLGMAMGHGAEGMRRPELQAAFEHVLHVAKRTNTDVMAVPFPDLSAGACEALVDRGVRILLHSVDELLFAATCSEIVEDLGPILRNRAEVLGGPSRGRA